MDLKSFKVIPLHINTLCSLIFRCCISFQHVPPGDLRWDRCGIAHHPEPITGAAVVLRAFNPGAWPIARPHMEYQQTTSNISSVSTTLTRSETASSITSRITPISKVICNHLFILIDEDKHF